MEPASNNQKYLPSKKFVKFIGLCVGVVVVFFVLSNLFGTHGYFSKGSTGSISARGTVGDVISRDSNNNGIADWEESLWGLDPEGDGKGNKQIIDARKKAAGILPVNQEGGDATPETKNDALARDLLSTILALNQAGSLTPEAITNIALSLGQNIDEKRSTVKTYTVEDLSVVASNTQTKQTYQKNLQALVEKYEPSGMGNEFTILAEGLEKDDTPLDGLIPIASAYQSFAKDLLATPTPKDASLYALNLINASSSIGVALQKASTLYTDIITGMVGVDEFLKGSDDFDRASDHFANYFSN